MQRTKTKTSEFLDEVPTAALNISVGLGIILSGVAAILGVITLFVFAANNIPWPSVPWNHTATIVVKSIVTGVLVIPVVVMLLVGSHDVGQNARWSHRRKRKKTY